MDWINGDAFQLERVLTNLLMNAINHSRRGDKIEVILESQASHQVFKVLDHGPRNKPEEFAYLTEREREILSLMAEGKTDQEIAQSLYIATGNVRVHVHAILHKLGARDRAQGIFLAQQRGLIPVDSLENKPNINFSDHNQDGEKSHNSS